MILRTRYRSICLILFACLPGCASSYHYAPAWFTRPAQPGAVLRQYALDSNLQDQILALDPNHISEHDIKNILSRSPAPRIINIHGGIYPVYLCMESFSKFLIGMGYPEDQIRNPRNGDYSFSCYDNADLIAGYLAWYYEKEGLRPMMIGHSQGGIQAVKILHILAGSYGAKVPVANPLLEKPESRCAIVEPFTGEQQSVVGLRLAYASAVTAGGLTRFMPNQWNVTGKLRTIPDSVEEFTGFYFGFDLIGGDFLGFAHNTYHPVGSVIVRTVELPAVYNHLVVPASSHLAQNQAQRDWINDYLPTEKPRLTREFDASSANILWAADVWFSIKKHWCLELQRLIRAQRGLLHES
jgi:hypothetical protein